MTATDTATISRRRMTHKLKTWPEFFNATRNGEKRFELRRNDRTPPFQVGDQLLLKEWDPNIRPPVGATTYEATRLNRYTGREILVRVDWIMGADVARFGGVCALDMDYVIMSISHVN